MPSNVQMERLSRPAFPQPPARPSAVLGDELDAGPFEGVWELGSVAHHITSAGCFSSLVHCESLVLNSRLAALTLGAFAFMKITSVYSVHVAAALFRALDSPNLLIMVRSVKRGLSKQFLAVLIGISNFAAHVPLHAVR